MTDRFELICGFDIEVNLDDCNGATVAILRRARSGHTATPLTTMSRVVKAQVGCLDLVAVGRCPQHNASKGSRSECRVE